MHKRQTLQQSNTSSISEVHKIYLDEYRNKYSVEWLNNHEVAFHIFLKDNELTGDESINIITLGLFNDWLAVMKNRDLSVASIQHYQATMRTFANWCMKNNYIKHFKLELIKGQAPTMKIYSDAEIEKLIKKPSNSAFFTEWRTWITVCFMLATGARAGTLVEIKLSDIDLDNREVTYRHLKNKHIAVIPLSQTLCKNIRLYLNTWQRTIEDGWFICDGAECKFTVNGMRQALDVYCKKRGVDCKGQHALRHTFARGWIVNGGNAFKLQKILTHSSLEMTKHYVALFGQDLKPDYENFSVLDNMSSSKEYTIKRH